MKYLIVSILNILAGVLILGLGIQGEPNVSLIYVIGFSLLGVGLFGLLSSKFKLTQAWWEFAKTLDTVIILALLIRLFVFQPFVVEGISMEPNFQNKEYLLVNKISYHFKKPGRGDVIVFRYPEKPSINYIKRIIGLPGEEIEIRQGEIYINGQKLSENYPENQNATINQTLQTKLTRLGPNEYFVLGDNRSHSSDSRDWGTMPQKNIIGKAWLVVYPTNLFGFIPQPSYANGL